MIRLHIVINPQENSSVSGQFVWNREQKLYAIVSRKACRERHEWRSLQIVVPFLAARRTVSANVVAIDRAKSAIHGCFR